MDCSETSYSGDHAPNQYYFVLPIWVPDSRFLGEA